MFKPGSDLSIIVGWQERERTKALLSAAATTTAPGTFAADAEMYLPLKKSMPTFKERARDIALWVRQFGELPRAAITPVMIQAVRERWLTEGPKLVQTWTSDPVTGRKRREYIEVKAPLSASTVCHRMRALENLYTTLGGRHARNPVREVEEPQSGERPARVVPVEAIRRLFGVMPESAAKARLAILAWTGIPPVALKRIQAEDFDRKRAAVWVPGRKKGKGTKGRWQPLTSAGVKSFVELNRWNAWGPHSWDNVRRAFYAAVKRLEDPAFKGLPPYALRGAFAARLYAASSDFKATQSAMGHASPTTTARYAAAALEPQQQAAVARLDQAERPPARRRKRPTGKAPKARQRAKPDKSRRTRSRAH